MRMGFNYGHNLRHALGTTEADQYDCSVNCERCGNLCDSGPRQNSCTESLRQCEPHIQERRVSARHLTGAFEQVSPNELVAKRNKDYY